MNKTVEGKKPRTYMHVITEKTAREGRYSAIMPSVEMVLLLVLREACHFRGYLLGHCILVLV